MDVEKRAVSRGFETRSATNDRASDSANPKPTGITRKAGTLIAAALSAILLLSAASFVLVPKNNQAAFGMSHQEAHGILGEPDNSIDVVFVGDSETTSSISPLQMWNECGFTSYVCATNGQTLPYSLTLLDRALSNQAPRIVVIEANSVYAPFSIVECAKRELENLFPVFEYHDRWKKISAVDFTTAPKATWVDPLKGFYINETVVPANGESHMMPSDNVEALPRLNRQHLSLFVDRCREAGAVPVIVATPSTVCWNTPRHEGMSEVAQSLGVDFIDLNTETNQVKINWSTDTRDAGDHLNYQGAVKVSRSLGGLLKQSYDLPDHRQDSAYHHWNDAFDSYKQAIPKR